MDEMGAARGGEKALESIAGSPCWKKLAIAKKRLVDQ
jgi:hypothetical protein